MLTLIHRLRHRLSVVLTAIVLASVAAVSGPAARAHAQAVNVQLAAQPYHQAHALSCEAAAAHIAELLKGKNVSEDTTLSIMGSDPRRPVMSGSNIVQWGDPDQSFVGDVNGDEVRGTGYGVYEQPIARAIQAAGLQATPGTNWNPATLYAAVAVGSPVVVWVLNGLPAPPTRYWTAWDGVAVPYGIYEHAETLVGDNDAAGTVTLANPWTGTIDTVGKGAFEGSFSVLGRRAVIVGNPSTFTGLASTPDSGGYWLFSADGGVRGFGDAASLGSAAGQQLNQPVVGGAATPDGKGYWLVTADGGIFPFGTAVGYGSTGGMRLNQPIVAMAPTPSGHGYWLVAGDGGIFTFGDAFGYGSTGSTHLNQPIIGMASTPSGHGYWLVASDGGIFTFGDAIGYGSTGAVRLNQPMVGMAPTASGHGYWLIAADGGIFPFGDAFGYGSTGSIRLNRPAVGLTVTHTGQGYLIVCADGGVFPFGDAHGIGSAA